VHGVGCFNSRVLLLVDRGPTNRVGLPKVFEPVEVGSVTANAEGCRG